MAEIGLRGKVGIFKRGKRKLPQPFKDYNKRRTKRAIGASLDMMFPPLSFRRPGSGIVKCKRYLCWHKATDHQHHGEKNKRLRGYCTVPDCACEKYIAI